MLNLNALWEIMIIVCCEPNFNKMVRKYVYMNKFIERLKN